VQFVISGKAHPRDDGGKDLIRRLVHFSRDPEIVGRLLFVEDYDMEVGRMLTQGVDVWLNNPRRPLEACGTSGMKAALNGGLNCSVLDGWWNERYTGQNGWAIGTAHEIEDPAEQDRVDASAMYDVLEREVVPRFYDRSEGPVPRRWVERIKHSISSLGAFVSADRMVRDYVAQLYDPAARQGEEMKGDSYGRARRLAEWKARVLECWSDVAFVDVDGDVSAVQVGAQRSVTARLRTGRLAPVDVCVQLAHGLVGPSGALLQPQLADMTVQEEEDGLVTYRGEFKAAAAGLYGFAVRVLPAHRDLSHRMEMGLTTWA
jgi:starch phosphorylase